MNWIEQIAHLPNKGQYSQFNEDVIIQYILKYITPINRYFVDIGAGQYDGEMSNTKLLYLQGWQGVGFDGSASSGYIQQAFIQPDNIIQLLHQCGVPYKFGFLNLDIDSSDYWVLDKLLSEFEPDIICTEFNGCLDPHKRVALEYEDGYTWDGTDKYGYSFMAGVELLNEWGYEVIYNQHDTNIFAVNRRHNLPEFETVKARRNQYHPHNPNAKWVIV